MFPWKEVNKKFKGKVGGDSKVVSQSKSKCNFPPLECSVWPDEESFSANFLNMNLRFCETFPPH